MAPYFERVLGLESVAPAVTLARKNAKRFPQARFECADAARLGEYFRRFGAQNGPGDLVIHARAGRIADQQIGRAKAAEVFS